MKAGWATKRLGEVCDIVNGGTPRTSVAEYWGGLHCWITPAEMGGDGSPYRDQTRRTLTDAGLDDSSASLVPAKSVILSSRAPIGHLVINLVPMATNQGCKSLVPKAEIEHKFLYYYLKSIVPLLDSLGTGATFKELSGGKLKDVVISFPPLPEQRRIVALLDEAFAGLATAAANAERNLENARELFESHLAEVFSRRGDGWVETTLGSEIDLLSGFAFKSAGYTTSPSGVRLLRGDNIIQGSLRWEDEKRWPAHDVADYARFELLTGDVVLAMDRPWVKAGLKRAQITGQDLPCLLVQRTARLRAGEMIISRFLYFLVGSDSFVRHIVGVQTGSGVPHVSGQQIKDFRFARPPLKAQQDIAAQLDSLSDETGRLSRLYEQKQAALAALKRPLLHQAFSGAL